MNRAATLGLAFGYHISMTDYFTLDTTGQNPIQLLIFQIMVPVDLPLMRKPFLTSLP